MITCIYCQKELISKQSKIQHELRCKQNPNAIIVKPSYGMLGKKAATSISKEQQNH